MIVLNHLQTKSLIEGGKALGHGKMYGSAFASGTMRNGMSAFAGIGDLPERESDKGKEGNKKTEKVVDKDNTKKDNTVDPKKALDDFKKWLEKLFDWIEVRLARNQRMIESFQTAIDSTFNKWSTRNAQIQKQLDAIGKQIIDENAGAKKYGEQADKVINQALKDKVVNDDQAKAIKWGVQNGTIKISEYSENVREVINAYKTWYDKMLDCQDASRELTEQQRQLKAQMNLENVVNQYDGIINRFSSIISARQAMMDVKEARGEDENASDYKGQIEDTRKTTENLQIERDTLQKNFKALVDDGTIKKYSEAWYEWESKIYDLDAAIEDSIKDAIEYRQAIINIPFNQAEKQITKFSNSLSIFQKQLEVATTSQASLLKKMINNELNQMATEQSAIATARKNARSSARSGLNTYKATITKGSYTENADGTLTAKKGASDADKARIANYNKAYGEYDNGKGNKITLDAFDKSSKEYNLFDKFNLGMKTAAEKQDEYNKNMWDHITNLVNYSEQLANIPLDNAAKAIEKISRELTKLEKQINATSETNSKKIRKLYSEQIDSYQDELSANRKARNTASRNYRNSALSNDEINKMKITKEQKDAIRAAQANGTEIDYTAYAKNLTNDQIKRIAERNANLKAYQEAENDYWDSYYDTTKNIKDSAEAMANAAANARDYRVNALQKRKEVLDAAASLIQAPENQNTYVNKQLVNQAAQNQKYQDSYKESTAYVNSTYKDLAKYGINVKRGKKASVGGLAPDSDAYKAVVKYNAALDAQSKALQEARKSSYEYTKAVREAAKQRFDNVLNYYSQRDNLQAARVSTAQANANLVSLGRKQKNAEDNVSLAADAVLDKSKIGANKYTVGGDGKLVAKKGATRAEKKAIAAYNKAVSQDVETQALRSQLSAQKELRKDQQQTLEKATAEYQKNKENMSISDRRDALKALEDLKASVAQADAEIINLEKEIAAIPLKRLQAAMDRLQASAKVYQDSISLRQTKGLLATTNQYKSLINNSKEQTENLKAQKRELEDQRRLYRVGSEEYNNLTQQIEQANEQIRANTQSQEEWNNAIAQLPYDRIQRYLDLLQSIDALNKSNADVKVAKGIDLSTSDYNKQINDNTKQVTKLQEQLKQNQKDLAKAQKSSDGTYGGKTIKQWQAEVNNTKVAINDLLIENEQLKDSLRDDVYWRNFERAHDSLTRLNNVISGMINLLSDDMFFDKNGKLTQWGLDQVALLNREYKTAASNVTRYSKDIDNLNKLYSEGWYTELEYKEKLNELQTSLLDATTSMKGYMDAIIELYKQMAQVELDNLNKLIDKRKDALNAKKDYYDYDKTLRNKNEELQNLRAQRAALEGVATAAAKAKRAQLEAQISDAEEDLDETIRNHEFEFAQSALDDLKQTLQDVFDERWNYIHQDMETMKKILTNANSITSSGMAAINKSLNQLLSYYGIKSSTGIKASVVTAGGSALNSYASGSRYIKDDEIAWTQEHGKPEVIIRKSDGAILTPLSSGDTVVPSRLTENLYKWGAIDPATALIGKKALQDVQSLKKTSQEFNVTNHYGSLLTVNGNVDRDALPGLEEILKKSYEYTTTQIVKDAKRLGVSRTIR